MIVTPYEVPEKAVAFEQRSQKHANLALTPIRLKEGSLSAIEPISLQGALAKDTIQVTELSAEGHVPQLRVKIPAARRCSFSMVRS